MKNILNGNIQKKSDVIQNMIIDRHCTLLKHKDLLEIKLDWTYRAEDFRILISLIIIPGVILSILMPLLDLFDLFDNLIFLLFILIFIIPFLLGYFYNKNRKTEWSMNKSTQLIMYEKTSPNFKLIKKYDFSEIHSLIIHQQRMISFFPIWNHALEFGLKKDAKKVEIFTGSKDNCLKCGEIVSNFLNKSLYENRFKIIRYE